MHLLDLLSPLFNAWFGKISWRREWLSTPGSSREYQTATVQEWLRGATPPPRSEGAAERRYPATEVRGGDKSYPESEAKGDGWKEHPMSRELWLCGHRRA